MARRRSSLALLGALIGAAAFTAAGVAGAQDAPVAATPQDLFARRGELEEQLPGSVPPRQVTLDSERTWGEIEADATDVRATLNPIEPSLRELFIDADDSDGDVARGVALVARGWLDVWTGVTSIAEAEEHDIAFPRGTTDAAGVATGADELRAEYEVGAELLLAAHGRLLEGYTTLRDLGEAELALQQRLDTRAEAAEVYDTQMVPRLTWLLSVPTSTVIVPTERFDTDAPGIVSRAGSVTVVCVDREELAAHGGVATDEIIAEIGAVDRADCPQPLPEITP